MEGPNLSQAFFSRRQLRYRGSKEGAAEGVRLRQKPILAPFLETAGRVWFSIFAGLMSIEVDWWSRYPGCRRCPLPRGFAAQTKASKNTKPAREAAGADAGPPLLVASISASTACVQVGT